MPIVVSSEQYAALREQPHVDVKKVAEQLEELRSALAGALQKDPAQGELALSELTVGLSITVGGEVAFIAASASAEVTASITMTFQPA
jgi:hypothetical protein